jgi:hypothetical protein
MDKIVVQDLNFPSRTFSSHISRCHPYVTRPGEDVQREALRGSTLYVVEEIVAHKVLPRRNRRKLSPSDIILTVKWQGYADTSFEPLSNISLRNSAAFVRYAQNVSDLKAFIKTSLPSSPTSSS